MLTVGDRVRINESIASGLGEAPKPGDLGAIEKVNDDGTLVVKLDDGRRAWLASWEVDLVAEEN